MERINNKNIDICPYWVEYSIFAVPKSGLDWCNNYKSSGKFLYDVRETVDELFVVFGFEYEHDSLVFRLANSA